MSSKTWNAKLRPGDAFGLLLIFYIIVLSLRSFRNDFDALWYHLPFAGLEAGIIPENQFSLSPLLAERFKGFPAFIDAFQGFIWKAVGNPSAANLVNPISILCLALYVRIAFRVSLIWTVLVFFAVPILQVALDAPYTDLWTNAFFSLHLLSGYKGLLRRDRAWKHAIISIGALGIAVNSKEQYYVIGGASFFLFCAAWLILCLRQKPKMPTSFVNLNIVLFVILSPFAFYAPIKNLIVYENPVYPEAVHIGKYVTLPGTEQNSWTISPDVKSLPQPARFILSELDFDGTHHLDTYNIDQRQGPDGKLGIGTGMGGSLGFLLLASAIYLLIILFNVTLAEPEVAAFFIGLALVCGTAFFPGSNELRYFSYIEICLIISCLAALQLLSEKGYVNFPTWKNSFQIILICSSVYVCTATRFMYVTPTKVKSMAVIQKWMDVQQKLQSVSFAPVICYNGPNNLTILYLYRFNEAISPHPYKIVEVNPPDSCPAGLPVIR